MIQNGILYLGVLLLLTAIVAYSEKKFKDRKLFKIIPGIVIIYIFGAILQTAGVFGDSTSNDVVYTEVKNLLLPAMLLLMLLQCDLRKIIRMGPKLLLTFFFAAITIVLGFTITYLLLKGFYAEDTWKAFAALSGSWTGGSANMVALQDILDVPENIFGYALIMDTINYSIWVMFMFWLVPHASRFNRWTGAKNSAVPNELEVSNEQNDGKIGFSELMVLIGGSIFISAVCWEIGNSLPAIGAVFNATTWTVIFASIIGLGLAVTPVAKIPGSNEISRVMLYIIIALIASHADFSQIFQAPIYIFSGFMILLIHALAMIFVAKVFKLDLFTMGVASLANIGGMASAPVLAGAYHRALVPVGVLMALLGNLLGTYFGIITAQILSAL